jgi:hypothetical protein
MFRSGGGSREKSKVYALAATFASTVLAMVILGAFATSAGATGPDKTPPTVTLSGSTVKAVEEGKTTGTYQLHIAATDGSKAVPQSGVAKIEVAVDGFGQQSWEKYCPEGSCGLEGNWTYSPASFPSEFPRWITVKVTDHAGNVTEDEISIEGLEEVPREAASIGPDTTPPTIAFSGSALEAIETGATTGKYELRMFAKDGSTSAPQSGVAKIEIGVDGTTLQSWEKYCPAGSCRLKQQWTYSPGSFPGTGHVITVTVRDHAGNVTTRTIEPDRTPPTIELSGLLTEGLKEGTTEYPLHVHAIDGEPEHPGSGVKRITISVDGQTAKAAEQSCPAGSCPMDLEWILSTGVYGFKSHQITILAEDQAGNQLSRSVPLNVPSEQNGYSVSEELWVSAAEPIPSSEPPLKTQASLSAQTSGSGLEGGSRKEYVKTTCGHGIAFSYTQGCGNPFKKDPGHDVVWNAAIRGAFLYKPGQWAKQRGAIACAEAAYTNSLDLIWHVDPPTQCIYGPSTSDGNGGESVGAGHYLRAQAHWPLEHRAICGNECSGNPIIYEEIAMELHLNPSGIVDNVVHEVRETH